VTSQEERSLGVAVLDIGGGTTDISVFVDGEVCYTAVLPVGGRHITHDIAVGLQTSRDEAERVKLAFGCASADLVQPGECVQVAALGSGEPRQMPRHLLAEVIEPRVEEIFELAKKEIEQSGYYGLLPMGVAITGGAALMPGMVGMASRVLEMTARVEPPRGVGGMVDSVGSPIHATAVGLVLHAAAQRANSREDGRTPTLLSNVFGGLRKLLR
jgi:cell division protein FtsA